MLGEKATFPGPKSYGNSPFNLQIGSFSEVVIMYCVQKHIMGGRVYLGLWFHKGKSPHGQEADQLVASMAAEAGN